MEANNKLLNNSPAKQLENSKKLVFSELIKLCSIADTKFKPEQAQVDFLSEQFIHDFPDFDLGKVKKIFLKGIKGIYDKENFQTPINSRTIFSWFNTEKKEEEEKTRYGKFIAWLNNLTNQNYKGDEQSEREFNDCIKHGHDWKKFLKALTRAMQLPPHIDNGFKLLTPTYIIKLVKDDDDNGLPDYSWTPEQIERARNHYK